MNRLSLAATNSQRTIEAQRPHDRTAVWALARTLIMREGAEAPAVAARRARELLDAGEIEGRLEWMRVMVAAQALLGRDVA